MSNTAESSSVEGVPGGGDYEEVPGRTFPTDVARTEPHPPAQDVHGGLTWAVVLGQPMARG